MELITNLVSMENTQVKLSAQQLMEPVLTLYFPVESDPFSIVVLGQL